MKNKIFASCLISLCSILIGCGKHLYMMNYKEVNNHVENAKEPGLMCFVVLTKGDTLKGKTFEKKYSLKQKRTVLMIDGKEIPNNEVHSYQNKENYCIGYEYNVKGDDIGKEYVRLVRGKISLFATYFSDYKMKQSYNSGTKSFDTYTTGGSHTTYYLYKNGNMIAINYASLKKTINDNEAALKQMDIEFQENGKPERILNDYRAFGRILDVYNKS